MVIVDNLHMSFNQKLEKVFKVESSKIIEFVKNNELTMRELFTRVGLDESCKHINVEDIYYDNNQYQSYNSEFNKNQSYFFLRLRKNTNSSKYSYFQLLFNNCLQSLIFKDEWVQSFIKDGEININEILELNKTLNKNDVLDILDRISNLLHKEKYTSRIKVVFQRQVFTLRNKKEFELSIDTNIKSVGVGNNTAPFFKYEKQIAENEAVVKLKTINNTIINELEDLRNVLGIEDKISKYCFALEQANGYRRDTESILGHETFCNARLDGDLLHLVKDQMDNDTYTSSLI
jgi:hypothetical protein